MPQERKHGRGSQGKGLGKLKSRALETAAKAVAITGQSRTQEQTSTLLQAVQNSSDLIGIANCAGEFTFVNKAVLKMTGRQPEELIGKHFGTIVSPHNPAAILEDIATKGLESEGWKGDCILQRHDQTDITVFLNVGPVKDKEGRVTGMFGIARDISERKEQEQALREAYGKLNVALDQLKKQAQDAAKVSELVDVLQSCQNSEEAYEVTANAMQGILRSTAGALCITNPSRDVVEVVGSWGNVPACEKVFRPDDCWALRRGKIHRVKDPSSPLRCAHVSKSVADGYICIPLAAQGETLGVLYVGNCSEPAGSGLEPGPDREEVLERQATAVGERISLALANLRLREVLRSQSIRDPLTGLFNRRFMEESLERELRRAIRGNAMQGNATQGKQQVALVMLDIDHFKHFNDVFGHQAGDTLLRALGNLLKESTRGQDVACRYGGEEFAFVLAGASLDATRRRAELLREDVKKLNVQYGGQLLGAVTLSIGIAIFPDNGESAEQLLNAADDALYRAKESGRDKIICA
jgi:diguanylate cyclase (GGDEF)-like protein/PAS domain S-box-containing protein